MASHRALSDEADIEERRNHAGNDLADVAAKEARARHPQSATEDRNEAEFYIKRAKWVARAIAIAMASFPQRGEVSEEKAGRGPG